MSRTNWALLQKSLKLKERRFADEKAVKVKKKIEKRIANAKARAEMPKLPNFNEGGGQTIRKRLNSTDVQNWFREGIVLHVDSNTTIPPNNLWWGGRERKNAVMLLEAYDGELVRKAVLWLCEYWSEMVKSSGGRLSGLPTVGLLWVIRDRVFPLAEKGEAFKPYSPAKSVLSRDVDEYYEDAMSDGDGW